MADKRLAEYFGEGYYNSQVQGGYSKENPNLNRLVQNTAAEIRKMGFVYSAFDMGCGTGLLVDALNEMKVETRGMDISPWAIQNAVGLARQNCALGDIRGWKPKDRWDLVISIETFQYLDDDSLGSVMDTLEWCSRNVLFSSDPNSREVGSRSLKEWKDIFNQYGFKESKSYNFGFVSKNTILFEKKNLLKVLFSCSDGTACGFYRCLSPARKLHSRYSDIEVQLYLKPEQGMLDWADIIVFQRHTPWHLEHLEYVRKQGKKTIFETDDLDIYLPPHNPLWKVYQWDGKPKEIKSIASRCDRVTVTTPILAEELRKFNKNVSVFPNMLDLSSKVWRLPRKVHDGIIIGWAGGSTHLADLTLLSGTVQALCHSFPEVKFEFCGYSHSGVIADLVQDKKGNKFVRSRPDKKGEESPWQEIKKMFSTSPPDQFRMVEALPLDRYPEFFTNFDISIAPIVDTRFNRSKSELKIIEAGAYGLPVVASDVGMYSRMIKHKKNGLLAKKGGDWIKYLTWLIKDRDLRQNLGGELRRTIERNYDIGNEKKVEERYKFFKSLVEV